MLALVGIALLANVFCAETSLWMFNSKKIGRSTSSQEFKQPTEGLTPRGQVPSSLSIVVPSPQSFKTSHSSDSLKAPSTPSPRVYTPSDPIPIPYSKDSLAIIRREESTRRSADYLSHRDCYHSSSDSSIESSPEHSPQIFEMSYEPKYAELLKFKREARANRRLLKQQAKAESQAKEIERPRLRDLGIYFSEGEEADLEEFVKKHRDQERHLAPMNLNDADPDADLDNDSDFGTNAKKECYSLSF